MNQDDMLSIAGLAVWVFIFGLLVVVHRRKNRYIKSFCPDCDNPIEFPARGIGQSIECPHCQSQIVLREISSKETFQRSYGWLKPGLIIAFVCVLLLCGTALFIYQDSKVQQLKRDEAAAALEAQKARDAAESNLPRSWREVEQARANALANTPAVPDVMERFRQRSAQRAQEDIAAELHRANDIAEQQRQIMADAKFNQRMQAFEQSEQNRKVINEIQEIGHDNRIKAINEQYDNRMNAINSQYQPQNQAWILKYNSFENRWQYVPPNAQLKYNALANRWEFVPQ